MLRFLFVILMAISTTSCSWIPWGKQLILSDDEKLGNFIILTMDIVQADLSTMRRQVLARTLVRVTGEIFTEYRHREAFVGIVARESHFAASAKSPMGATGISQVMPQYAPEFAKLCGLSDFKPSDLADVELNLYLGACFYRDLLEKLGGNTTSAEIAYNGGLYGEGLKALLSQKNIKNVENSNYPVHISYTREQVNIVQEKVEETPIRALSVNDTIPVMLKIEQARIEHTSKTLIRVKYVIKNSDEDKQATGTTVLVGIFVTKDGRRTYITNPPVVEDGIQGFLNLADLNKRAQPFSFKKKKDYELTLSYPKNTDGYFETIQIITTDARSGGQMAVNLKP